MKGAVAGPRVHGYMMGVFSISAYNQKEGHCD